MKKPTISLLILGLALLTATGRELPGDTISKTFKVEPNGKLTIKSQRGSIQVKTGSTDDVAVEVIRTIDERGEDYKEELLREHVVSFNHSGKDVSITAESPRDGKIWNPKWNHLRVKFLVTVPSKYNVDLGTAGGSISVSDLEGTAQCKTSGGGLTFGKISGPVIGRTSGGSIKVTGCNNNVDVETSGGGIELGEVSGSVKARTSGGSIKIARASGDVSAKTSGGGIRIEEVTGTVEASTSGGSVSAKLTKQPAGACTFKTSGGSIDLAVDDSIRIDLDARTSGGGVRSDLTVDGHVKKSEIRGTINGGGPQVTAHTSGGSVHIRKI